MRRASGPSTAAVIAQAASDSLGRFTGRRPVRLLGVRAEFAVDQVQAIDQVQLASYHASPTFRRWAMTPAELRAVSRLGGQAFAGLVSRIEQVHQAIGGRAFGSIGPVSAPVRFIHDSIARGVYRAVGSAGPVAGVLGAQAASRFGATGQDAARGPASSVALATLNAFAGDRLGPDLAPLAIRMAVRVRRQRSRTSAPAGTGRVR